MQVAKRVTQSRMLRRYKSPREIYNSVYQGLNRLNGNRVLYCTPAVLQRWSRHLCSAMESHEGKESVENGTSQEPTPHREVTIPPAKRQPIIYFDVDGQIFRTTPETLNGYPGSLLHRLVKDYPEVVAAEKPLFVDRRPDCFPWILECYRDSHYKKQAPDVPRRALGRELDFYGLPASLLARVPQKPPELMNARLMFDAIVQEVRKCDMQNSIPLEIWVYNLGGQGGQLSRRIFPAPSGSWYSGYNGFLNEHKPFMKATHQCTDADVSTAKGGFVHIKAGEDGSVTVLDFSTSGSGSIDILNEEAAKHGLRVEQRYMDTKQSIPKLPYLYLHF